MKTSQESVYPASRAVLACYGGMACVAIAANLAPVFLTTFSETFGGLTEEQLGRIPAVIFATMVVGILVGGPPADRWGGKPTVLAGLVLTVLSLVLLAGATTYAMLLAACGVMGLATGVLDMVLSPIVCALRPHNRAHALNWLHAFYCVGALTTVLAGAAALRFGVSWRIFVLSLNAVPLAVLAAFLTFRVPPFLHESVERTAVRTVFVEPFFWAALAAIALCGATEQGMAQWLPAYAERSLGFSKAVGGVALALFSVGMVFGRLGAGSLSRMLSPRRLLMFGCAGCVVAYLLGAGSPNSFVALVSCIAMGVMVSCLWPTTLALAADKFPHGGASLFSYMAAAGNFGCIVTPWAIGIVSQAASLPVAMACSAMAPLLLFIIFSRISVARASRP